MSEYIISPWFFYWVNIVDRFQLIVAIAIVVSFALAVFYDELGFSSKTARRIIRTDLVLIAVLVFCPDKDALIQIQVAKMATVENVSFAADTAVEAVRGAADYIIEAMSRFK